MTGKAIAGRLTLAAASVAALLASSGSAFAAAPHAIVTDAWMRAMPANIPAGGYFTLHNNGGTPLTLTGASSPACGMLMLHKTEDMSGMSRMEDVSAVDVPPGGEVKFAPGGYHLMCMNPAATMKPGGTVKVTLRFKGGETLESDFAVRNAAGK
jgi:copper(I)-binding protein